MRAFAQTPQPKPRTRRDCTVLEWSCAIAAGRRRRGIAAGPALETVELDAADLTDLNTWRAGKEARLVALAQVADHPSAAPVELGAVLETGSPREILAAAERFDPFAEDDPLNPLHPDVRERARQAGMRPADFVRQRAEELAARIVGERVEQAAAARAVAEDNGGDPRRYRDGSEQDPHVRAKAHGMGSTYGEAVEWVRLSGSLRDDDEAPARGEELERRNADEARSHELAGSFGRRRVELADRTAADLRAAELAAADLRERLARAESSGDRRTLSGLNSRLERQEAAAERLRADLDAIRAGGRLLTELLERRERGGGAEAA